jgi:plasmid stabilization system protein ParE
VKPLHYHPSAQSEIDRAHDWYLRQSPQAADGFYEELIPALDRIRQRPGRLARYLYGTQRLVLSRYPFSVVFRERPHDIQIVAVAHAKRRPGYWAKRIEH